MRIRNLIHLMVAVKKSGCVCTLARELSEACLLPTVAMYLDPKLSPQQLRHTRIRMSLMRLGHPLARPETRHTKINIINTVVSDDSARTQA